MHGWMRSHILQLLGCICEFEMLHAYLMLWRLKITDLAGCVQADMGCVARSVILRPQSIRYACSISNSHMHPSNCKICDRIHPCMIQLYGGSSQPASQPASAASLSVTLIKIVDRSHYSPAAGSPPRGRGLGTRCPPVAGGPPACRLSTPRPATESSGRRRQTAHSQ